MSFIILNQKSKEEITIDIKIQKTIFNNQQKQQFKNLQQ